MHVFREESTLKCCFLYLWDKLKRLCPYNKDIRLWYPAHKHHELRQNFPRSNSSIFPLDSSLFPWLLTLYIVFPLLLLLIVWTHWSMEGSLAKLLFEYVTGSTWTAIMFVISVTPDYWGKVLNCGCGYIQVIENQCLNGIWLTK